MRNLGAALTLALWLWGVMPAAASPIQCVPMPLPDGSTLPGFCFSDSQPPPQPLNLPPVLWPAPDPLPLPLDLPPLPDSPADPGSDLLPLSLPPSEDALLPLEWPQYSDPPAAHSPEPAGFALMSLGLAAIGASLLRRSKQRQRTE